jgi:anaerobic C4-dicarboxylate transporter DcuA
MSIKILLEFLVILGALAIGSRVGGIGLGVWGAVGLLVLTVVFGAPPTAPPVDVMLIIVAVIIAASSMEASGGIDYLVGVAERIIRRNPKHITIVAPLVAYFFTFAAGTGHIFYPLLPVMYEVSRENGIRPERPIAVATIASQQAITASPVSAATAAVIALLAPAGVGLTDILMIAFPATLIGVIVAALVQTRIGVELADDPEYKRRLAAGEIEPLAVRGASAAASSAPAVAAVAAASGSVAAPVIASDEMVVSAKPAAKVLPKGAMVSAIVFLTGVALVVLAGAVPELRPLVPGADGAPPSPLGMPATIEIVMLATAAVILTLAKPNVADVPKTNTCQAGITAVVGIFGLAWLGDTFIAANKDVLIGALGETAAQYPSMFAVGLFAASVLLFSQASTTRALFPLGISLGIAPHNLIGMFPAVNGYFLLPNYGTIIAAINFDRTGTTGIGKYVLNHSFMLPGMIATTTAVVVGLAIASVL